MVYIAMVIDVNNMKLAT